MPTWYGLSRKKSLDRKILIHVMNVGFFIWFLYGHNVFLLSRRNGDEIWISHYVFKWIWEYMGFLKKKIYLRINNSTTNGWIGCISIAGPWYADLK